MRQNTKNGPGTRKVRRLVRGSKRADGWRMQREGRKVRRPDPRRVQMTGDPKMSAVAGLVDFGAYVRGLGEDRELARKFGHLKQGHGVVYPMAAQIRTLVDLAVADFDRVFGIEAAAADAGFAYLCGGVVPSCDVLYDDLARFDDEAIALLEEHVAEHGLARLRGRKLERLHLDVDTTVTPLWGHQEGALAGPNPQYHARPSYHPITMRAAETDTIVGAKLRPGDTAFGASEIPTILAWIRRVREAVGPQCVLVVRIDAAGDCGELLEALDGAGVHFVVKAKFTRTLAGVATFAKRWRTVDRDAFDQPTRQVATLPFRRDGWKIPVRVVAVRTNEVTVGRQIRLWDDNDYSVATYLTNDWITDGEDIARTYNDRAGIEPLFADLKNGWAIGKASSASFSSNHAAFLIKLLAYNLLRRFASACYPTLRRWRTYWLRRTLILRPGRLVHSGRQRVLRVAPLVVRHDE